MAPLSRSAECGTTFPDRAVPGRLPSVARQLWCTRFRLRDVGLRRDYPFRGARRSRLRADRHAGDARPVCEQQSAAGGERIRALHRRVQLRIRECFWVPFFTFSVKLASRPASENNWCALVILTEVARAQKRTADKTGTKGHDGERNRNQAGCARHQSFRTKG